MIPKLPAGSRTPRPGIGWFNQVADAVNAHQSRKTSVQPGGKPVGLNRSLQCLVKNTTTRTLARFEPLDIGGIAIEDSDEIVLIGVEPDESGGESGKFVICQQPLAPGQIGRAVVMGLTRAILSTGYTGYNVGDSLQSTTGWLANGIGGDAVLIHAGTVEDDPRIGLVYLGGSAGSCQPSYEIRHWYYPSSGHSEIEVEYNDVTEPVELPFNGTPSQVKTAIDAHSEMVAAGVQCSASSIPGGNLWRSAVIVRMPIGGTIGLGATPDADLVADASTDYVPHITVVECGCQ